MTGISGQREAYEQQTFALAGELKNLYLIA